MAEAQYLWLVAVPGLVVFWLLARTVWAVGSTWQKNPCLSRPVQLERYRPLSRLLDESEFEFLRSQPGYTPRVERALRQQRVKVFRKYLQSLAMDFRRLQKGLRLVIVSAQMDRPDLVKAMYRHAVSFWLMWMGIQLKLSLYELGIRGIRVDVEAVVQRLAELKNLAAELQPAYSAARVQF